MGRHLLLTPFAEHPRVFKIYAASAIQPVEALYDIIGIAWTGNPRRAAIVTTCASSTHGRDGPEPGVFDAGKWAGRRNRTIRYVLSGSHFGNSRLKDKIP
jgi:hypothetical protein